MDARTASALRWLLESEEPAVRHLARRDLLGADVTADSADLHAGPWVSALLTGGLDVRPYRKWTGAHWRLVSLAELGASGDDPRVRALADRVLDWLSRPVYRQVRVVNGLARRCASIEGNALAACCALGYAADPRVGRIAEVLLECQWPDGGWNCDLRGTRRSSFHETCTPMWGLYAYGEPAARQAAGRAAELLLEHRLFRSLRTGDVINRRWLDLRYPPYWHYDILQALLLLSRMGLVADPRAADALDEVERRRLADGRWRANGSWWRPVDSSVTPEVVDWGRSGPQYMVTLNALRVLRAAGRVRVGEPATG
jgi:hypothetical protein